MSQLGKKCFVGSCVMHGLLFLVLILVPAFVSSQKSAEPPVQFIELVRLTDLQTRGGTPSVEPIPAPAPAKIIQKQPDPVPVTPPPPEPKPVRVEPKVEKPAPVAAKVETKPPVKEPDELAPKPKVTAKAPPKVKEPPAKAVTKPAPKPPPKVDLSKVITNNPEARRLAAEKAAKEKADREAAIAAEKFRRQAIAKLRGSISSIKENTSSTVVEMAGGSGGEVYVNYKQLVQAAYHNAWVPPDELADSALAVRAEVTIDRSGNVIKARPMGKSGNRALDTSVERALKLQFIAPFPEGSKDAQRDFIIKFDLKARRSLG